RVSARRFPIHSPAAPSPSCTPTSSLPELSASFSIWLRVLWNGGCWPGIRLFVWTLWRPADEPRRADTIRAPSRGCARSSRGAGCNVVVRERRQPKFLFSAAADDSADVPEALVFSAGRRKGGAEPGALFHRLPRGCAAWHRNRSSGRRLAQFAQRARTGARVPPRHPAAG